MPDETPRRQAPIRGRQSESRPPSPGWKVTPAPDGRGAEKKPSPRSKGPNPRWLVFFLVVGLLALNLWISSQALKPNARVQIPYSPTFVQQVTHDNVAGISSTGSSIQG